MWNRKTTDFHLGYLSRRAQQERAIANSTLSQVAQKAHLELAFRYERALSESHPDTGPATETSDFGTRSLRSVTKDTREQLEQALNTAFPLPGSGAFPDLLSAIDEAGV